jgi:hypothetical protein
MHLVDGRKVGLLEDSRHGKAAIARNDFRVVTATETDVEASHLADRHAATTAEKAVRKMSQAYCADDFDSQSDFLMITSSSA